MFRTIKKLVLSLLSILGLSFLIWVVLLLNPNMVYSNTTIVDNVSVYHNLSLDKEAEATIRKALEIISLSEIYDDQLQISLCMNDHNFYPKLHPTPGGTAYAFLNKTIIYRSKPDIKNNTAEFSWVENNYELRKYDLTYLLAHEFMHNVQHDYDSKYQILSTLGKINWKLEGHADYIAREFKNDGLLLDKIEKLLYEENQEHVGVPVFKIEDGTIQNLAYFKYALLIQYLMEEKQMDFSQICALDSDLDELYADMIEWSQTK